MERCRTVLIHPGNEDDGNVRWNFEPWPSGHVDDFARRNLPPPEQWPELRLERPEFHIPNISTPRSN
jgi:hypothetical protein